MSTIKYNKTTEITPYYKICQYCGDKIYYPDQKSLNWAISEEWVCEECTGVKENAIVDNDFSGDIRNFELSGTDTNNVDKYGNLYFYSSSIYFNNVYLSLPLTNIPYQDKIKSYYTLDFEEFVVNDINANEQVDLAQKIDTLESENSNLRSQLETVLDNFSNSDSQATQLAVKQVILELRKSLGEGRVDSDFSEIFPYAPLKKEVIDGI